MDARQSLADTPGAFAQQTPGSAGAPSYGKSLAPAPRNGVSPLVCPCPGLPTDFEIAGSPEAMSRGAGTGRSRARPQLTVEQSRHQRITYTLYQRMQELRKYKSRERRKRGPIVDSWYKCKLLPDGYDSEEDESNRWAGVDAIPITRVDGVTERREEPVEAGDAGATAKRLAKSFNRLAWAMDGVKVPRPSGPVSRTSKTSGVGANAQQNVEATAGKALAPAPSVDSGAASAKKRTGNRRAGGRGRSGANADASSMAGDDSASVVGGSMRKRKRPSSSRLGGGDESTAKASSGRKRARKHLGDIERESVATDDDGSVNLSDDEGMDDGRMVKSEGPGPSGLRDEWDASQTSQA